MRLKIFSKVVVSAGIVGVAIATSCQALTIINQCTDAPKRTPLKFVVRDQEGAGFGARFSWEKAVPPADRGIATSTEFSASELERMREWLEVEPSKKHRIEINATMQVMHIPDHLLGPHGGILDNDWGRSDRTAECLIILTQAEEVDYLNDATITFKTPPEKGTFVLPEERVENILVKPAGERGIVTHQPSP